MSQALVLEHGADAPPGLLTDWAADRGITLDVRHAGDPLPALNGQAFIVSLGSDHNPNDTHVPMVARELRFLEEAVRRDVPVLGLCFGGQMLAKVLGGTIEPAPTAEIGWHEIETTAPDVVPPGPWLQWHYDRFTLPPGAEQLASSPAAVQAFTHGRHMGVQFHPESTIEIVRGWAKADQKRIVALGIEDGEALLEQGRHHAVPAARAAFDLFDAFRQRTRR